MSVATSIFMKDKRLVRLNRAGGQDGAIELVGLPQRLAADRDGRLYVGLKRRVLSVARNGSFEAIVSADVLQAVVGSMAVDNRSRLWVLEAERPRLKVFAQEGSPVGTIQYNSNRIETRDVFVATERIYLVDEWEGILVYSLKSE